MDAFFYIDKPSGQTSFDVLRDMRRILWVRKIWHSGTLDPLATGWLLVATGNYTKLIPYVEKDSKKYLATIFLDGTSASFDSDTEISYISEAQKEEFSKEITSELLEDIFKKHFFWKITQVPPKYSALKIDGKRALDRTLAGEEIEMKSREVEILSYDIKSFTYPELVVEITVTAGTYIRSIAHDLWQILGTGWYLTALRRTGVWALDISLATQISELSEENALDPRDIFGEKIVSFSDETVLARLANGQRVKWDFSLPEGENIFLFWENKVQYIVEYRHGVLHPRKKVV